MTHVGPGHGFATVAGPALFSGTAAVLEDDTTADTQRAPGGLRILVIDDNRDGADTLAAVLRALGYQTCTAYDGFAALAAVDAFRPDAMVVDIGLPGIDGFSLARSIRGKSAYARSLMIALTAYRGEEYRLQSKQAGFDHYLVKPADLTQLRNLLQQCAQPR
jgi:CheY-like chemotaxis protein